MLLYALLDAVATAAGTYFTVAGEVPPSEIYVTPSKPSFECCDAVIVWASSVGQTKAGFPHGTGTQIINASIRSATIHVALLECVPTIDDSGHYPSLSQYSDAARRLYDRGELLYSGFLCDIVAKRLFKRVTAGQEDANISLSDMKWDPPNGGCVSAQFSMNVILSL